MIEFQQWIGFLIFAAIGLAGFWVMLFLIGIIPYWIAGYFKDLNKQKKAQREEELSA